MFAFEAMRRRLRGEHSGGAREAAIVFRFEKGSAMRYKGLMDEGAGRTRERVLLAAILAAAAAVRFARLGAQSLWVDEILSLNAFSAPEGVSFRTKLLHDVHGPLYSFFMHFWSMASTAEAWLRLPGAAAGVLTVYLVHRWLARLGGGSAALPGALFVALSPFHLYYSQEVRFYSFLALFCVASLMAFERYLREPSTPSGLRLGLALALACLSHLSALFLAAALVLHLLFTGRLRGAHLRAGAAAAALLLILVSPWIYREIVYIRSIRVVDISALPVEERLRGELTLSPWSYPYLLYAFSVGYSFGPSLRELHVVPAREAIAAHAGAIALAAAVFGPLAVAGLVRSARRGLLGYFLAVFIVAVASVTAAAMLNIKVFNVRYLIPAFPFYTALLAFGLPARRPLRWIATAAVAAVMLAGVFKYHGDPAYAREDVRSAAAIVERVGLPGDLVVVPTVHEVFRHYYEGRGEIRVIYPADLGREGLDERVAGAFAEHHRIWYVRSRHWDKDPEDLLPAALSAHGKLAHTWEFPGVLLMLYEK
jgi:4-amino-4-deoxy-L-arabinose transferase-like glycosyltransferase